LLFIERLSRAMRGWRLAGRLWEPAAVAGVLVTLAAALVWQAWRLGITVDEPSHLLSSHLYWQGADRLEPRDLPPLIKIVCGWVPGHFPVVIPFDIHDEREKRSEWELAQAMMSQTDRAVIQPLFFWTRLPLILFPLLTTWLVWRWGRLLWGPVAGVALAAAYAFAPTALGHGALIKNDIAATFAYLLFWFFLWSFWRAPSIRGAAGVGAATLLALLSKMSMLWLACVGPLGVVIAMWRTRKAGPTIAAALALTMAVPYLGTLAACQFETRRISAFELDALGYDPLLPKPFLAAAQAFRVLPLPVPLWKGALNLMRNNGQAAPVYLLGAVEPEGSRLYFLVALLVKAPLPILTLVVTGMLLLARDGLRRRLGQAAFFWIVPGLLYITLASLSSLQLGVRLILPALPFGLLIAGRSMRLMLDTNRRLLLAAALAWVVIGTARAYPNSIAYLNEFARGQTGGLPFLADSNFDWGQGLPYLAEYLSSRRIPVVRLAYFGNDVPRRFLPEAQVEPVMVPWSEGMVPEKKLPLRPGYYAVSATLLPGHFFPPGQRDYFDGLRRRIPDAIIGNSIYFYHVR
jgi:hypothetical protein